MSKKNKRLTTGFLILGMVAAAPLAFAQTPTEAEEQTPPATGAAEQQPTQSSAAGQGLSWADLDVDGNGSLSRQEAQVHAGLSNVFAEADVDANGELTADEYRGFIQKQQDEATQD
ncbi:calcium-binding protein [Pseudoxanthomonas suwonensis]|uniref:Calcium-binding protein n=1 Tax=Pseudoxanthomonas suwonensis TaxID=314722 RepID=A0A0E3Z2Z9_9GAMM|nr:calcium-binding protein [Pseudoxanthomonas suwonensis]AKC87127.1 calcium-binding protein [Pseudoxanthomonas suwonensis]